MTIDEASAQLQAELNHSIAASLGTNRPILHHLNADSSWLLQIPRPKEEVKLGRRRYFNILFDPWLAGGQSDVAAWFSTQWHAHESKCPNIAAVEDLIYNIEATAVDQSSSRQHPPSREDVLGGRSSLIDVVAVSHEFTDHCHKATLLEINQEVPVFATEVAADLISSWNYFQNVQKTPSFGSESLDWTTTTLPPLPPWLAVSRAVTKGDALYYHSALLVIFDNGYSDKAESVIYTPHGIHAEDLEVLQKASPPIRTLCFLHGMHDIQIASQKQLNLGAHNGLKAQRILHAKYWIGTHDEVKKGGGIISWMLNRKIISLQDALEEERKKQGSGTGDDLGNLANANWLELGNGESRVLI